MIFDRIEETKKKIKDIRGAYKDVLATSLEYIDLGEKIKTMRTKRKQIEETTKQNFASELTKLDDLQIDLAADQELLTDKAVTQLMKGEPVEIVDQYGNKYDPVFKVKFKKQ